MEFVFKVDAPKFKQNLAGLGDRFSKAISASLNMVASMIKQQGDADIQSAGKFGGRWTEGFHVAVLDRMRIKLSHDIPYAGIFQDGGTISGTMMWIPLSGTDAKGIPASEYPGGVFSVNRKAGGAPLLFSIADKQPKYFGTESVTIPKKFHLYEIATSVMAGYRQIFDTEFKAAS